MLRFPAPSKSGEHLPIGARRAKGEEQSFWGVDRAETSEQGP